MKSFIYDHYGYSIENENKEFEYNNFTFSLESHDKTLLELEEMNNYTISLARDLYGKRAYIVPTRKDKLMVNQQYENISLVAVENFKISIDDLIKMHQVHWKKAKNIKLSFIKNRWINKLDFIENKVLPSLRVDDYYYQIIFVCFIHSSGMACNAITYLQDCIIDYGDNMENVTLAHKRMKLTSYDLINPFNLIVDSPMRDLAELYKNDLIDDNKLFELFKLYQVNNKDLSLFFSRLLYPSQFFDLLEEEYEKRENIFRHIENYYFSIEKQEERIKKIHSYLTKNYGLRNINWL